MNEFDFLHQSFNSDDSSSNQLEVIPEIYLVEDDQILGQSIQKYLQKSTALVIHYFEKPSDALLALDQKIQKEGKDTQKPFCLITDISFDDGGADGLLLIDLLKEKGHRFVSIAMTGFASIETAINATKKGVFHYLTKPFELEDLAELVFKAMAKLGFERASLTDSVSERANKVRQNVFLSKFKLEEPKEEDMFCGMIGRSPQMKQVFERIQKVAASDSTVLVNGPSGTGKELVANAIHTLSARMNGPLVSVNCGAIPAELLESELFGHEKGSFTGAISSRKGRFELANQGTIFLDEIGDMPLLLQVKLLRVLQNRTIERVGANITTPIDVRIVTATHRDLEKRVQEGDFREDLFYRLNVIPIRIPSLRERREDIPLLISHFLGRFVSADGRNRIDFDDEALEILLTYDWPGNVRELENLIERLVILKGGGVVSGRDLPAKFLEGRPGAVSTSSLITLPEDGIDLKLVLGEIEDSLIAQALERTDGNKNQASKLLRVNRTTLIEKMKKKGLMELQ
tara:strand:+ start:18261 stop:19805 length:1545 start_codon:yes stop_codon:yes gene_type:complete